MLRVIFTYLAPSSWNIGYISMEWPIFVQIPYVLTCCEFPTTNCHTKEISSNNCCWIDEAFTSFTLWIGVLLWKHLSYSLYKEVSNTFTNYTQLSIGKILPNLVSLADSHKNSYNSTDCAHNLTLPQYTKFCLHNSRQQNEIPKISPENSVILHKIKPLDFFRWRWCPLTTYR